MFSTHLGELKNKNLTIEEFCSHYASMIEHLIDDSHHNKCPKIEANYDDYQSKTLKPFNATIMYYFMSLEKNSNRWARWCLAAARYPNHRVRRAYSRFFA